MWRKEARTGGKKGGYDGCDELRERERQEEGCEKRKRKREEDTREGR